MHDAMAINQIPNSTGNRVVIATFACMATLECWIRIVVDSLYVQYFMQAWERICVMCGRRMGWVALGLRLW